MDVVGYSAGSTDLQFDTIAELNREVHYVLYHEFDPNSPQVIALPTGDGMILALLEGETPKPGLGAKCLDLLLALRSWTDQTQKAALRYGLHYGAISFVRDVNGKRNICGDAVNIAARLMSLGQSNHIVASSDFVNRFFPGCEHNLGQWTQVSGWDVQATDEIDTRVKHHRRVLGYNFLIANDGVEAGHPEELDIKYHADVRFPAISKAESRKRTLSRILPDAERLTFLGLTYTNLPVILDNVGENCRQLILCLPSESLYGVINNFFGISMSSSNRRNVVHELTKWTRLHSKVEVKLLEYSDLPPFGAMLAERSTGIKGFLHVSHYLRGIVPESTPFIEVSWNNTVEPPQLYSFYAKYLSNQLLASFISLELTA